MSRVAYNGAAAGLKIAAGAALGCGMLACTWTLASSIHDLYAGTADVAMTSSVSSDLTFGDRFAPAALMKPAEAKKSVYVALYDPGYSLGGTPENFRKPVPVVVASAEAKLDLPPVATPPAMRQAALAVPLPVPAQRSAEPIKPPAELKLKSAGAYSHDALVSKARNVLLAQGSNAKLNVFEKLFKSSSPSTVLAFAGSDGGVTATGDEPPAADTSAIDRLTAIYDITAKTVYMPDGSKLEAHSGLGSRMDNPDYAHLRMQGVTPPHIYDLKPREALFHGVAALRMTPLGGESAIHNRNGLLTHSYMLGPNGQSNGCVSFKDYNKFLAAYRRGEVKRMIVVAKL